MSENKVGDTYICSHCGTEYKYNWFSIKRYLDANQDSYYMLCPKDGGLCVGASSLSASNVVGEAIVGEAIVG